MDDADNARMLALTMERTLAAQKLDLTKLRIMDAVEPEQFDDMLDTLGMTEAEYEDLKFVYSKALARQRAKVFGIGEGDG